MIVRRLLSDDLIESNAIGFDAKIREAIFSKRSNMCVLIPDDTVMKRFQERCSREGFSYLDLDVMRQFWIRPNKRKNFENRMSGWCLQASTATCEKHLALASTISDESLYLVRAGWIIVLCLEGSDDKTAKEILRLRNDSKVMINVEIGKASDILSMLYMTNNNAYGLRMALIPKLKLADELQLVKNTIINSCYHIAKDFNRTLRVMDGDFATRVKLVEMGASVMCSKVSESYQVDFTPCLLMESLKGGSEIRSKQSLVVRCLCCVGVNIESVCYVGNQPMDLFGIETAIYPKRKGNYVLLIHRSALDYGLPVYGKTSSIYEDEVKKDIAIISECKRDKACVRIVYIALVRQLFDEQIFPFADFESLHWPYDTLETNKMILLWNKGVSVKKKTIIMIYGPPGAGKSTIVYKLKSSYDIEDGGDNYETRRLSFYKYASKYRFFGAADMRNYDLPPNCHAVRVLLLPPWKVYEQRFINRNKANPLKSGQNEKKVYEGFSSNQKMFDVVLDNVDIEKTLAFLNNIQDRKQQNISLTDLYFKSCGYNLWKSREFWDSELESKTFSSIVYACCILGDFPAVELFLDDTTSEVLKRKAKRSDNYIIAIKHDKDWVSWYDTEFCFYMIKHLIFYGLYSYTKGYRHVTSCNGAHAFLQGYAVTNIPFDIDHNHLHNSQTMYMQIFPRMFRTIIGYNSMDVYAMRSEIAHSINPEKQIIVSQKANYIDGNTPVAVSGHMINMLIAHTLMPIDMKRWLHTINGNFKYMNSGDDDYKAKLDFYLNSGYLVEEDGANLLWHIPVEYLYCSILARELCLSVNIDYKESDYFEKWVVNFSKHSVNPHLVSSARELIIGQ